MTAWYEDGLVDDIRPRLFDFRARGETVALATIVAADGGPRPVGAQMLIAQNRFWGFLSGGCIEADVASHAQGVLANGEPVRLTYGQGSPFVDMRLPCAGRIEILVERIEPSDKAVAELERLWRARTPARWRSDGRERECRPTGEPARPAETAVADVRFDPPWRLLVVGEDPFALAIAAMGKLANFGTVLLAPFASDQPAPFDLSVDRRGLSTALIDQSPDPWTATVLATHDTDLDHQALALLLRSGAGYIGVVGARRRIDERTRRLCEAGFADADIGRIHMPLGLPIRARSPWEVAVSAIGEIVAHRRSRP